MLDFHKRLPYSPTVHLLVGGIPTPLKNEGLRQLE